MKKTLSAVVVCALLVVAATAFAQKKRAHDHIGNFNFRVEIEGVTSNAVKVKAPSNQDLKCPSPGVAKFNFFEAWPSKVHLKALKTKSTYIVSNGKQKLTLTGCNAPTYFKDDKLMTFKFEGCK